MRAATALAIALPFAAAASAYAWSAYVRFQRYARAADPSRSIDLETFQILVHDELTRDLRRLRMPEPPEPPTLPVFELSIGAGGTKTLVEDAESKKKRRYVKALLRLDGQIHKVEVRHQGRRHWHAIGAQKSMKVRAETGTLIDGVRVFNLLNDVTPFGLEEDVILGLARDEGLLAPEYHPVRVRVQNADLGVYRFEAQPDEGLLRRAGRMPGAMFSGSFERTCRTPEPTRGPCNWRKFAWRSEDRRADFTPLDALLDGVYRRSHRVFAAWVQGHLDLDRFATFDALDVVFGGEQHDFASNQKLYFDPYRGRFEPIARDFRAFTHEPQVNLEQNALRLRLTALPDYRWRRDRAVYRLATGAASSAAVRATVDRWFDRLLPELRSDPHWDAYKLLPRATKFHRQMVRPMTVDRWLLASKAELRGHARRTRWLVDRLEARSVTTDGGRVGDSAWAAITVDGHGAHRVETITVHTEAPDRCVVRAPPPRARAPPPAAPAVV